MQIVALKEETKNSKLTNELANFLQFLFKATNEIEKIKYKNHFLKEKFTFNIEEKYCEYIYNSCSIYHLYLCILKSDLYVYRIK